MISTLNKTRIFLLEFYPCMQCIRAMFWQLKSSVVYLTQGDGPFVLTHEEEALKASAATSDHDEHVDSSEEEPQHEIVEFFEETPLWVAILTYLGYAILILFGHFRDVLRNWKLEKAPVAAEPNKEVWKAMTQDDGLIGCAKL